MGQQLDHYKDLLDSKLKELFSLEPSGHDLQHLLRVYNLCLHIQETEGGNRLVLGIAALLHDVHRLIKKEGGKLTMPEESLPTIEKMLNDVNFPGDLITPVLQAIKLHEDYSFGLHHEQADDLETKILQDADRLEAIGAIGIGRCFVFYGAHGLPMWEPEVPMDGQYDASTVDPNAMLHFHRKLLKLGDDMHTETGKRLAIDRHAFMVEFYNRFLSEWKGEK